jgi:GTP-binding protein LepA
LAKQKEKYLARSPNSNTFRAYIFDSWFEANKGCNLMVRVYNGKLSLGSFLEISAFPGEIYQVHELGVFSPNQEAREVLLQGEVGFVACNLKKPKQGIQSLGGSLLSLHKSLDHLPKPPLAKPVVFASIFPDTPEEAIQLEDSVEKILLEDPAISCERDNSTALGNGFRCGFLGELHLEIFQQRLFDEFGLHTIVTPASVVYQVVVSLVLWIFGYGSYEDLFDNVH